MKSKQTLVCGLFAVLCALALLCAGCKGRAASPGKGAGTYKTMFGSYPVNYTLAYLEMLGSKPLTIRDLFGPDAVYASVFSGIPATVTLESASGTKEEFNAQFLLAIQDQTTGKNKNTLRLQFQFQPNDMTEKSYVRYLKVANIVNGQITEQSSRGGEREDARMMGMFLEFMQVIWDEKTIK